MGGSGGARAVRASLSPSARVVSAVLPSHPWGSSATSQRYWDTRVGSEDALHRSCSRGSQGLPSTTLYSTPWHDCGCPWHHMSPHVILLSPPWGFRRGPGASTHVGDPITPSLMRGCADGSQSSTAPPRVHPYPTPRHPLSRVTPCAHSHTVPPPILSAPHLLCVSPRPSLPTHTEPVYKLHSCI